MKGKLVGKRIKSAREESGITQEEFAEKLGVSVSFISQVEGGGKKFNLSRIIEASKILEKPVEYFIDGYERKKSSEFDEIISILNKMGNKKIKMVYKILIAIIESDEEFI